MARIVVLGAGFAGLWAAIGAARKLGEIGAAAEILVVDRYPYHNIRVRNYEVDLSDAAIPLAELLDPIGVKHMIAEVIDVDAANQQVAVTSKRGTEQLNYDRLVMTLGSELIRPAVPGFAQHAFDVDTYGAAVRLNAHLAALGKADQAPGRSTVVVVGAGFTGIEVAAEMPAHLARVGINDPRIILIDPSPILGATMGDDARPVIGEALKTLAVETRLGVRVTELDGSSVTLSSGEVIPARTVVWCAGMAPSPLTASMGGEYDRHGRLVVDKFMRAKGLAHVFAAGDVASCSVDGTHSTVMSCQFARPMGRFAGHNVVADLFGQKMLPMDVNYYVTVLDLGDWGALYTSGWDRRLHSSGAAAKLTKQTINQKRIYPPRSGDRAEILAAAAPTVQAAPVVKPAVVSPSSGG
jgi:NADH:ubiquinone reductase (H+-translocating)